MLDKLTELIPIPTAPIDTSEKGLVAVSKALGVRFPADFLEYSRTYGSGTISAKVYDWEIYSAFRRTYPEFVTRFVARHDAFRRAMETEHIPLGLFPEPGGLLPFGRRDSVFFCWRTVGRPNDWTVGVIWEYQEGGFQLFDLNFSEFLTAFLARKLHVAGYTTKWNPKKDITFESEVYSG